MSARTAELDAPSVSRSTSAPNASLARRLGGGRLYLVIAGVAIVIAALSLLIPSTPSYDPWAWLVWGKEIIHVDLHTTGGPSWKPLPMIFTTLFAVFGRAQPDLWLLVARAGALVAIAMIFRVTWRLTRDLVAWGEGEREAWGKLALIAPLLAGLIAAGSLINSSGFISDNALGYSEGLTVALMLIAVDRFLDGKPRQAFIVGFFAALDRPELWLFWGPYGLYLFWRDEGARKLVIGLFVMIPVLWFLPELWGSGHLLRGVTRAQHPRANSAAFTSCPVCTVFKKEAWPAVPDRVKIPGLIAMLAAAASLWRTRSSWWRVGGVSATARARFWLLLIGGFGWIWWVGIALETQAGFSGNNRYLVLGSAPVAIAGALGWGWFTYAVGRGLRYLAQKRRALRAFAAPRVSASSGLLLSVALLLFVPGWIGSSVISVARTHRALLYQAHLREDLRQAVNDLGGPAKVLRCGPVMTEGFQVPMVAWTLGVRTLAVEAPPGAIVGPPWPSTIFQTRDTGSASLLPQPAQILAWEHQGAKYKEFRVRTFIVFSTCAARVSG